ncbi:uncharacterized protein LOC129747407 [Uranotaenia lowii]|uniref:uncharacterized protein LOC129747407 n=1 Tax=Uranotaenia lowii TaxID=190385 RepID=UPI002479A3EB|nr:uncharacterized protein LOC129747407 [Uranotaenia lowii]
MKLQILAFYVFLEFANALRSNLTMFTNCRDIDLEYEKASVSISNVQYDRDEDGVCSAMHVEYNIHASSNDDAFELILTSFQCPLGTVGICSDNPQEFIEPMHCDRFHSDESGPWFMMANAMSNGDRCGRLEGKFNLDTAILKLSYLDKYIDMGKGSYRVRMLFHVPNTDRAIINMKGCCEMDFDVID